MSSQVSSESVFEFADYKKYLREMLKRHAGKPKGKRTSLARALGCQPAYLSRVLNVDAHLSAEQAYQASTHFGQTDAERRYFLLLVLADRAGSPDLQSHFRQQLNDIQASRLQLKNRVTLKQSLSENAQFTYYSAWYFAAVHMMLTIPSLDHAEPIASFLGLSQRRVQRVLRFLESAGLAQLKEGTYRSTTAQVHLAADSPLISRHHTNWRLKALEHLEPTKDHHLHYSSVVSLAKMDILKVREILIRAIEEIRSTVASSPPETLVTYSLDLFPLDD